MNQRNQLAVGNMIIRKRLTAGQLGYTVSEEELTRILRIFNCHDILIALARINLLLQRTEDSAADEKRLKEVFCSDVKLKTISAFRELRGSFIFERQSTLFLLCKSACVSDPRSGRSPDILADARDKLAECYLIANGLLEAEEQGKVTSADRDGKELMAEFMSSMEYAVNPSPLLKNLLVRSEEFLRRLQEISSDIDINETFFRSTGLALRDYQYLIFSTVVVPLSFSPEEIPEGKVLFINTKPSDTLTPLYDKLLQRICLSIDELALKAQEIQSLPNEFRLWRKYPLVKISEDQVFCVDIDFLLEKLQTGVFWIIRDQLAKENKSDRIFDLWGEVFEDYAASIIERGISAQTESTERCFVQPQYDRKGESECTDIAICGEETLILVECKTSVLTASAKFSGDFSKLYAELKNKIIEGEKPKDPKGLKQLWNAIQSLGHKNTEDRYGVKAIDISKVKRIYPVLILSDRIFSCLNMNWFLDLEFQRMVKQDNLEKHLEIMPLTVLTITDLEFLEPYLSHIPFHVHLDEWIAQFQREPHLGFNAYLHSLMRARYRENLFMNQEFTRIVSDTMDYLSLRGLNQ